CYNFFEFYNLINDVRWEKLLKIMKLEVKLKVFLGKNQ
ncbi:unnamed protein product, partial [marine sediment metagenome]